MSKHTHPKETPKVQPSPTEHETQFFRHPVKTTRYHSKKTWFKIGASTFLLAVLTGMGTWLGSAVLDWSKNHHFVTTDEQQMIHKTYWQNVAMQRDSSNLWHEIHQIQGQSDAVGQNNSKNGLPFTAEAGK